MVGKRKKGAKKVSKKGVEGVEKRGMVTDIILTSVNQRGLPLVYTLVYGTP